MRLVINRQSLAEALGLASQVVLSRTPKPVLTCVKLETKGNVLSVTATDMELAICQNVYQCDITTQGSVLVPAHRLADIVNNSPDDTLTIAGDADSLMIKGSDANYKVNCYAVDDFPPVSKFDGEPDITIPAEILKGMLTKTKFAAAREMTRYAINGVFMETKNGVLNLAATDGHRLAHVTKPLDAKDVKGVVPIKAVALIDKLFTGSDVLVDLKFESGKVFVCVYNGTEVYSELAASLIEGTFPPYADVMPKDCDKHATISREKFLSAVVRAKLMTNEESKGVRLSFADNKLAITAKTPEYGEAKVETPCQYDADAIEIGFNPGYLIDALKVCSGDTVRFDMSKPTKQVMLIDGAFKYVVMPVNLE